MKLLAVYCCTFFIWNIGSKNHLQLVKFFTQSPSLIIGCESARPGTINSNIDGVDGADGVADLDDRNGVDGELSLIIGLTLYNVNRLKASRTAACSE